DPMIAKLVTWGETRDEAADRQVAALDAFQVQGLGHNIDFVSAIMQHPRFRSGELSTGFIAEEYPEGFHGAPADETLLEDLALLAGVIGLEMDAQASAVSDQLSEKLIPSTERVVRLAERDYEVR